MSQTILPTLTSLTFSLSLNSTSPPDPTTHFLHAIINLLSPQECASIITSHQNLIPSNVTPGTKRDREAFDEPELSFLLWSRLVQFYGNDRIKDEDEQWWRAKGLNERFRLCRYLPGGKFSPHQDGRYMRSVGEQSFMTVNIYLNTVPEEWKGATRVLSEPRREGEEQEVLGSVQPVMGSAAVFRDSLWHDGEELAAGEKYLLRTEVMYEREVPFDFEDIHGGLDDEGKGRKALALAEGLEDAGNSKEAVGWYKKAFRLAPGLERGGG